MRRLNKLIGGPAALAVMLLCLGAGDGRFYQLVAVDQASIEAPVELAEIVDVVSTATSPGPARSAEDLLRDHALQQSSGIGFDPLDAEYLDDIDDSPFELTDAQREILAANGFVFTGHQFPTFAAAYDQIYVNDLPVYISADMMQFAIHRSYDAILKQIEIERLIPELRELLSDMRAHLRDGRILALGSEAEADVDVYLAVALALLNSGTAAPVRGGDAAFVDQLLAWARAADGFQNVSFFGSERDMDFSQFEPRGHYTDSPELERYFRAMMWLGRTDLRVIETIPVTGEQVFNRRQFDAAAGIAGLLDDEMAAEQQRIADVIGTFVGQSDNMTAPEMAELFDDLGVDGLEALAALADARIELALIEGHYGEQRIASHMMETAPGNDTLPLSATFLLFGQAYIIDSEVFANVVYDRIPTLRLMPDPLDVAYAVLGNDQAAQLLADELRRYEYAGALDNMRNMVDSNDSAFWQESLYNLWLNALRQLSPGDELADPAAAGLPSVFATEAWGRRLLNTQLASWAELRHDTLLYAKQSYTVVLGCDYPDVYVDPYPEYFRAVADYANAGHEQVSELGISYLDTYFTRLGEIANILAEMADRQRRGLELSDEHLEFANAMIRIEDEGVCAPALVSRGWYSELFVAGADPLELDPTVADVHTQPSDEMGNMVGRILHVGTGQPRLMTVVVDTPQGPKAFVGAVSTYYEEITSDFERLTDEDWVAGGLNAAADVEWLVDLISR